MPEKIGHYTIVSELGRGGMGVVYKAREESLDRFVAIKVLTERLTDDDTFLQRFVREARAAASVSHPNIVQIFFIGEQDGNPYFVMEYVAGQSLNRLIRTEGQIGNPRAAQLVLQAAHGLAAAHERGLIHRDIKPANLILDPRGIVKIADFGLALPVAAETRLTAAGMLVGTPGYLAPEQCRGEQADHRTDIYALGVTFYEILTGTQPFKGDSPLALLRQILDEEPPDITALNPDVDEETRRILAKMLAKDRSQRYQSCHEIVAELEQYLADRGVRSVTSGLAALTPQVHDFVASTAATEVAGAVTASASSQAPTQIVDAARTAGIPARQSQAFQAGDNVSSAPAPATSAHDAATIIVPSHEITRPDSPLLAATTLPGGLAAAPAPANQTAPGAAASPSSQPQAASYAAGSYTAAAPAKRSSSRALIIVVILAVLLGGALTAGYVSLKMFRDWRGGHVQSAASTTAPTQQTAATTAGSAPQQTQANTAAPMTSTAGALLSQPLNVPQPSGSGPTQDASAQQPPAAAPQGSPAPAGRVASPNDSRSTRGAAYGNAAVNVADSAPRRSEPQSVAPRGESDHAARGSSRVAVAAVGDRGLVSAVSTVVMDELQAAGLEAVDAQTLSATEDLVRGNDVSVSRLIDGLRREGSGVLLLVRLEPAGERQLNYMGRSDTAYSTRVTLTTYDVSTGRQFGSRPSGSIEYTALSAQRESEKVAGRLARSAAESITSRH